MNITRILHPTDFTEGAGPAFDRGVELARHFQAELHVLHVIESLGADPIRGAFDSRVDAETFHRELRKKSDRELTSLSGELESRGVTYCLAQRHGQSASEEILLYAQEQKIDLVVMGTHGRRGFRRMIAGSVAMEVVRKADAPVLTAGSGAKRGEDGLFERVLVPIDFSEHSRTALRYARSITKSLHADLHALHVFEKPAFPAFYEASVEMYYGSMDAMLEQARAELARLNDEADEFDLDAVLEVRVGYAVDEILKRAREVDASLIVVSTHGATAIPRFFMGSVSERLIRSAAVPVLRVRTIATEIEDPWLPDIDH